MSDTTETDGENSIKKDEVTETESKEVTETESKKVTETKSEKARKLLSVLIDWMRIAAQLKGKSGADKKKFVLKQLRDEIQLDELLEEFILATVDLLIDADKNGIHINPIAKRKFKLLCC